MDKETNKRIILWAHPRSCSTAFFRMMVERGDFFCIHEPFCTLHDKKRVTILFDGKKHVFITIEKLISFIITISQTTPLFIKETTDYYYDEVINDVDFTRRFQHAFLFRDLPTSILSHYKINPQVSCSEIGYENLFRIYQNIGRNAVIMNAEIIVDHPEIAIKEFCGKIDIPFLPDALKWHPKELPHWKETRSWHEKVTRTRGFLKYKKNHLVELRDRPSLHFFYEYHRPFYDALLELSKRTNH